MNYYIQSVIRIVFFLFLSVNNVCALTFVNRESSFVLHTVGGITSRFRLGPSTVNGWSDGSIRKDNNISQFNLRNEAFNSGGDYIITSSSAREDLVNSNSNAIVKLAVGGSDLAINNSNLLNVLAPLVKQSSNAINALEKTSNLAGLVRTTSNAFLAKCPLIMANSNTINRYAALVKQNSSAINAVGTTSNFAVLVRTTSNAVNITTPLVMQSSNAIVKLAVSGSDLAINNSNLLNVLAPLVKQSSNAINAIEKTSNLAVLVRTTSNTVNVAIPLIIQNSNAINALEKTSNLAGLVRATSNAFLAKCPLIMANSNTINRYAALVKQNSSAINAVGTTSNFAVLVRTTSNAVNITTPLVMQSSNAIVKLAATTSDLAINNSNLLNVLAPLVKQSSNAINAIEKTSNLAVLVRTTSNTVNVATPLIIQNSNAINALEKTSNLAGLVRATSNAFLAKCPLIMANSNTINRYAALVKQNSSAVVNLAATSGDLAINNSNLLNVLAPLVKQNSNAIINNIELPNIDVFSPSYFFIFDYFVSPDSLFRTHVDMTIDGGGHFMIFARNKSNTFQIDPGTTVILTDVVLKDFSDAVVQLGAGSRLIFGPGTVIELASTDALLRDWSLFGNVIVNGNGHYLNLAGYSLQLAQNGSLVLQNVQLQNVAGNNLRCVGDVGLITLQGSTLYLSSDFSYTTGSLRFDGDVVISGTSAFNYNSNQPSTVAGHSLLFLGAGLTFNYAPGIDNRNLIVFEDVTSRLFLDGCTLLSTTTGLQLTRGTLLIDNKNYFFNNGATALSEGIRFGNGIIIDDLTINILPGASIILESGIISYDNVGL